MLPAVAASSSINRTRIEPPSPPSDSLASPVNEKLRWTLLEQGIEVRSLHEASAPHDCSRSSVNVCGDTEVGSDVAISPAPSVAVGARISQHDPTPSACSTRLGRSSSAPRDED